MKMTGCVYKATSLVDGRVYIGKTIQGLILRKREHKSHCRTSLTKFAAAVREQGFDNFIWEELYLSDCDKTLCRAEVQILLDHKSLGVELLNRTFVEQVPVNHSPETRKRIADAQRGRERSPETRQRMSEGMRKYYRENGRSESHSRKLSETNKGRVRSESQRRGTSEGLKKKFREDPEYRQQNLERIRIVHQKGFTTEHRAKISAANKLRAGIPRAKRSKCRIISQPASPLS
jgi:hypothetical protein